MATYAGRTIAYAERVVRGEETAGRYERRRANGSSTTWPGRTPTASRTCSTKKAGARACKFIELLPHIKGQWARPQYVDGKLGYTKIKLEDWQVFIVINLFAWKHAVTGLAVSCARTERWRAKNAKSTLAAGILLFMCTADAEPGARLQRCHHRRPGARVFDVARNMALREPGSWHASASPSASTTSPSRRRHPVPNR